MKTLFIALALLVFTRTGFGQGAVDFNNLSPRDGIDAPVYYLDGSRLSGTDWYAQLYYRTVAHPPGIEIPYVAGGAPLIFGTGVLAGYFDNTVNQTRVFSGLPPSAPAEIQVRVWRAADGPTYEAAAAQGEAYAFNSIILPQIGATGSPKPLTGLQPMYIPEPSTIALGLISAGALFLRRRK